MCIISAYRLNGLQLLSKTRDRNYEPVLELVEETVNGVKMLVVVDTITGWVEGLNEYGFGVVNSALMVARDENEKHRSKGVKKSKDGLRVLEALGQKTLDASLESLRTYEGGIKGHTFAANPEFAFALEATSKHRPFIQRIDTNGLHVRTNHGIHHLDAGYSEGEDLNSSMLRRELAYESFRSAVGIDDYIPSLHRNVYEPGSGSACIRNIDGGMRTGSHLLMDLTNRHLKLYVNPDICTMKKTPKKGSGLFTWEVLDWPT